MAQERRYDEAEVAAIFRAAARPGALPPAGAAPVAGLTLGQMEEIAREVGIAPARVAEEASALELRRGALPRRTALGMPVAVARSVDLPRAPTAREWDVLVAELRETFHATGRDASRGELRAWANGNLHAAVEPTAEGGWRFRISTRKGDAGPTNTLGAGALLMSLVLLVVMLAGGDPDLAAPAVLAVLGAAALAFNAVRLPAWAGEREAQMERLAARARALVGPAGGDVPVEADP